MKKNRRKIKGNAATTTAKDWGFGPVPGKGGKTRNYESIETKQKEKEKC